MAEACESKRTLSPGPTARIRVRLSHKPVASQIGRGINAKRASRRSTNGTALQFLVQREVHRDMLPAGFKE